MCCLFGVYTYGEPLKKADMYDILSCLGDAGCDRGVDATGIAYVKSGNVIIEKAAKCASEFDFKVPEGTLAVMGHTRQTTQGAEKFNRNNHPFKGSVKGSTFALAHNGIIVNDTSLRKEYNLPLTKIETDSYIAVQLLEASKALSVQSVKDMSEKILGSFCFSILDNHRNMYLVKGDNPLYIIHHRELKSYFYASTDQILWKGIVSSDLFPCFKKAIAKGECAITEIPVSKGDILCIRPRGSIEYGKFTFSESRYFDYRYFHDMRDMFFSDTDRRYIDELKSSVQLTGNDPDIVDVLLHEGYSYDEIEEYVYGGYLNSDIF